MHIHDASLNGPQFEAHYFNIKEQGAENVEKSLHNFAAASNARRTHCQC